MKILLLLLLLLSSCSAPKTVVQHEKREVIRCDSVGAKLSGELNIRLNDVVIFPSDSTRARVSIKSIELKERKHADVVAESHETFTSDSQKSETPRRQPPRFLLYLIILVLLYLFIARK